MPRSDDKPELPPSLFGFQGSDISLSARGWTWLLPSAGEYSQLFENREEAARARDRIVDRLLSVEAVSSSLDAYFDSNLPFENWRASITHEGVLALDSLTAALAAFQRLYGLFLTVARRQYFVSVWLRDEPSEVLNIHRLRLGRIVISSPGEAEGIGIAAALRAISDCLSIGKQIEAIRMANLRVEEAKLQLHRQRKMVEKQDQQDDEGRTREDQLRLTRDRLELSRLETELRGEEEKRREILYRELQRRLDFLLQKFRITQELPEEFQSVIRAALQREAMNLLDNPLKLRLSTPEPRGLDEIAGVEPWKPM